MKYKIIAAMLMLGASTMLYAQDGLQQAQREFPKITAEDLGACKKEIAELHREAINYVKNEVSHNCNKGRRGYDADNCSHATNWEKESSTTSNLVWFMEGNTHCSDGYVCYGLSTFNENPRADYIRNTILTYDIPVLAEEKVRAEYRSLSAESNAKHKIPPQEVLYWENETVHGAKLFDLSMATEKCMAKIWLAKLDGKAPAKTSAVAPKTAAAGGMSPQKITSCSEDIKRKQVESQSWGGNVNDVSNRLGKYQKDLFEGRCAGHPEATAYIAGANKMLGVGGNATGSGGGALPPLAAGGATGPGSPDSSRSRKIHNPAADAKGCVQIVEDSTRKGAGISGHKRFVNNCGTTIELFWCALDGECQRDSGNTWTVGAGKGWPIMTKAEIRWGACKGRDSGGMDRGTHGEKYTCPNLTW